jgi:hypothetical protein
MRSILRMLGTRYGIALLLTVLVLGAVGLLKAVNGSYRDAPLAGPAVEPSYSGSVDASADNDSVQTDTSPPPPVTSPGATPPTDIAASFARAWLAHDGVTGDQWRAGLKKYATAALLDKLKDTDPAGVPARRMAGPVTLENHDSSFVIAIISLDSGTLRLYLRATNGRWLVDGVDWVRQ